MAISIMKNQRNLKMKEVQVMVLTIRAIVTAHHSTIQTEVKMANLQARTATHVSLLKAILLSSIL
jgi:hypothetical protein